jgi:hypothetical protein
LLQIPAVLSGNHYFSIFTLQAECVQNDCKSAQKSLLELSETIQ